MRLPTSFNAMFNASFSPTYVLITACLLICGCQSAPTTPDEAAASLERSEPASRWLIWGIFGEGYSTYEVAVRDGEVEVIEIHPEIRIATTQGIWRWTIEDIDVVEADCACFMEKFHTGDGPADDECRVETTKPQGGFQEIGGDRFWAPEVLGEETTEVEYTPKFEVTGSLGSRVFVTTCIDQYPCGAAHPNRQCEADIVDLETLEVVGPSEFVASVSDGSDLDFETDEVSLEASGVDLVELKTRTSLEGSTLDHRYVTDTCYACSNGGWSSYTASAIVEAVPVDGQAASDAELDPALRSFVESPGPGDVHGWSRVQP